MAQKILDNPAEAPLTKWHESLVGVDLLLLFASPVYYSVGVPRGDGSAVIMIPGFMHGDVYLMILYAWLSRVGYRPYYSGIDLNAECPDLLIKSQLNQLIDEAKEATGSRVHLIGHSLGGIIARSLAIQRPRSVASVITLGSPLRGAPLHPSILRETEVVPPIHSAKARGESPQRVLHRELHVRLHEIASQTRSQERFTDGDFYSVRRSCGLACLQDRKPGGRRGSPRHPCRSGL